MTRAEAQKTKAEAQNDEEIFKEYVQIAKAICWKVIISSTISTKSLSYLQNSSGRMGNEEKILALRCPILSKCGTSARKLKEWNNKY